MKSLRDVWNARIRSYTIEVQNYMKYIFTGHLAVVLLFAIGAAGFAYSEWLKTVPADFPGALLLAAAFGTLLAWSPPATLLKEADSVYLLPLESRLGDYMQPALRWSFMSQLYLPVIVFIVSLPMVNALYGSDLLYTIGFPVLLLLMKRFCIQAEYAYRKWTAGENVWRDRGIRFLLSAAFVYLYTDRLVAAAAIPYLLLIVYSLWLRKHAEGTPFPFGHFIALEEGRMLRFYRFANYFTDVPHLKGKIRERKWLNPVYRLAGQDARHAHLFLVLRTFIRSDDLFYLWIRLTVISVIGALLIPYMIGVALFTGALAFATAIQLWQSLQGTVHFRMDELFPLAAYPRKQAVFRLIMNLQLIQAAAVALAAVTMPVAALAAAGTVAGVSFLTLRLSLNKIR